MRPKNTPIWPESNRRQAVGTQHQETSVSSWRRPPQRALRGLCQHPCWLPRCRVKHFGGPIWTDRKQSVAKPLQRSVIHPGRRTGEPLSNRPFPTHPCASPSNLRKSAPPLRVVAHRFSFSCAAARAPPAPRCPGPGRARWWWTRRSPPGSRRTPRITTGSRRRTRARRAPGGDATFKTS
jgi:hypothetical protein